VPYEYDVAFIGAGPGGYTAAIRARQLGLRAVVVEKEKPGGVCLNIGCIPSKALIDRAGKYASLEELKEYGLAVDAAGFDYGKVHAASRSAADRLSAGVGFLLKKNGIDLVPGTARISGGRELTVVLSSGGERKITASAIVVATGSRPREVPGFEFDEDRVLSSTGALMLKKLPTRLTILGAGAIGMEFAYVMNAFGVQVTVVEMLDRCCPWRIPRRG
jgi:dihydrolipoamide dehydrogenase